MKTFLFLDVTGVLLCSRCGKGSSCGHLDHLKRIVDALDCDIVLTSSFRHDDRASLALAEAFARHGIPEWIGTTPDLGGERWTEIESWIREHGIRDQGIQDQGIQDPGAETTRIVIIDDGEDADLRPHAAALAECHFFLTDIHHGLDAAVADAMLQLAAT